MPNTLKMLVILYRNFVYNPEFLRERSAEEDFINSEIIILGASNQNNIKKVKELYEQTSICKKFNFFTTDLLGAPYIKYAINSFLALKVAFFNQFHELLESSETSLKWEDFASALKFDSRIGKSHLQIPGPDGKKGFGGACFPKDTAALVKFASEANVDLSILEAIIYNNKVRKSYSNKDEEKDQSVNFDFL